MTSQPTIPGSGSGARTAPDRARALGAWFADRGFEPSAPGLLQPAEVFIHLSGEDIRRRLCMVTDPAGRELCLRPDFTIPVARAYLDEAAPEERRYCYAGSTFRYRGGHRDGAALDEFEQTGIEIFGAANPRAADKEVVRLTLDSVMAEGLSRITLRIGDIGLFNTLIDALDLPDYWRRRIRRHFWRHDLVQSLDAALSQPRENGGEAMAAALEGLDRKAAADMVEEVLALAGIVPVGGRTAEEIAQRFMERASSGADALPDKAVAAIRDFLAIDGEAEPSLRKLRAFAKRSELALGAEIDGLTACLEDIAMLAKDAGLDKGAVRFEAGFGRNLEYYTGLVFEICDPANPGLKQIAGGGRYDNLLSDLGASKPIPAVGCGIYVDRLLAALEQAP